MKRAAKGSEILPNSKRIATSDSYRLQQDLLKLKPEKFGPNSFDEVINAIKWGSGFNSNRHIRNMDCVSMIQHAAQIVLGRLILFEPEKLKLKRFYIADQKHPIYGLVQIKANKCFLYVVAVTSEELSTSQIMLCDSHVGLTEGVKDIPILLFNQMHFVIYENGKPGKINSISLSMYVMTSWALDKSAGAPPTSLLTPVKSPIPDEGCDADAYYQPTDKHEAYLIRDESDKINFFYQLELFESSFHVNHIFCTNLLCCALREARNVLDNKIDEQQIAPRGYYCSERSGIVYAFVDKTRKRAYMYLIASEEDEIQKGTICGTLLERFNVINHCTIPIIAVYRNKFMIWSHGSWGPVNKMGLKVLVQGGLALLNSAGEPISSFLQK